MSNIEIFDNGFKNGKELFRKVAIKKLEEQINISYNTQSKHYLVLTLALSIIKNLKP